MALRNFCMDGASSFASGTVVAQMIVLLLLLLFLFHLSSPSAVCLSVFNLPLTDEKYSTTTIMLVPRDESA